MVFGSGGGKITKRMLLAVFIIFNMTLLSLGNISATTETVNVSDSNLTSNITENVTNTTNLTNSTNLTDIANSTNISNSETNSSNKTAHILNTTEAAGDISNTKNVSPYPNITGIWLRSDNVATLDVDALLKANITDIFVKVNTTNYQSVLTALWNKVSGTLIRINAWITCFQTTSSNGTTTWVDPQGKYNYQVKVPYTVKVQTPYKQAYKGWYTKAYKVKVKKWYKSYYKYHGKWKYKWKYYWTYKTTYKKVYGWLYKTVYKTSYVTKYKYETRYGYNTTYNTNLVNFISNVTKYSVNGTHVDGIHLDYVRYPGTAYKYTNATQTITSFVAQVYNKVKSINSSVAVSAALMPEKSVNAYYYGQDYKQLAPYLDFMVPMIYKGNYGYDSPTGTSSSGKNGTDWIGSTVAYIVSQAGNTPVVAGLQTYRSDNQVDSLLPADELQNDINAAIGNGSSGYALFRCGLISSDFMTTKSVSAQGNTTNSTSTGFTLTQLENAAASVKSFIESNNKLPNYVTIGSSQITMPQFLQMLVTGLLQINSGTNTAISAGNISNPVNSSGNYVYGNIYTTEYLSIAQSIKTFINSKGVAPNYASSSLGNIQYETLVYMFSKVLNYYGTNKNLPNYVSVDSSIANPSTVSSSLLQYLQATANCQVNNPSIKTLATKITAGKTSVYDQAVAIFNWVRYNLGYSFYYNTKYGAVGTLNAKTGNCVDTAHLLVALERAAGIPARYEHVYAKFSSGNWYGHVIAQVYVNGKWYNADATSYSNNFGVITNWNTATATYYRTYASLPF